MKRVPEPNLPLPRASLPEGCSDLAEAYKLRDAAQKLRGRLMLRVAAMLYDPFIAQLDPEILRTCNEELLKQRISDFLHPLLLANPEFENWIKDSSELVETLFEVVMAHLANEKN